MANPRFKENIVKRAIAKSLQPLIKVISPKLYVSLQYRYITGHKLEWDTLSRYTEKLQYLRLYYYPRTASVIKAASRDGAREVVTNLGLSHLLIPQIGLYEKVADIDFNALPNRFVIKATHACALNYICLNKDELTVSSLKKTLNKWLHTNYGRKTVEPHYSKIKPRLLIEQYVGDENSLPLEYKIHVFNGKARYLYVVSGRGGDIRYDNLFIDFTPFPAAQFNHWSSSDFPLVKPSNYDKLVAYAEKLAKDFLFCRVDFFIVKGKIYFNEFTFTPAKGTLIFDEDSADYTISEWLDISTAITNKAA